MLFQKLNGIIYTLGHNDSLLKGNYFKEKQSYSRTFEHFRKCGFERNDFIFANELQDILSLQDGAPR